MTRFVKWLGMWIIKQIATTVYRTILFILRFGSLIFRHPPFYLSDNNYTREQGAEERQKKTKKKLGNWEHLSGGREVDVGGRSPTVKPTHRTIGSITLPQSSGVQILSWSKWTVLVGKKLAFKLSAYIFKFGPSLSTPTLYLPCIHSRDECSRSSTPVYHCERKRKVKTGEGPGEQG